MPLLRAIATTLLLLAPLAGAVSPPAPAAAAPRGYVPEAAPGPAPALAFTDGDGRRVGLADFAGSVVLLNLWATWCGPCVQEIPALDRLQARLGGRDFQVVAVSVDRGGGRVVGPFLARMGIGHLAVYLDPESRSLGALGIDGLPTSLLLDRAGRVLGRVVGDPGWDSPEALRLIESAIGQQGGGERGSGERGGGGRGAPPRWAGLVPTSGHALPESRAPGSPFSRPFPRM